VAKRSSAGERFIYLGFQIQKNQRVKLGPKSTFPLCRDGKEAACTWMVKFRMTPFMAVTSIEVFESKKRDQAYTKKNVLLEN
jgi:hypothetical protein